MTDQHRLQVWLSKEAAAALAKLTDRAEKKHGAMKFAVEQALIEAAAKIES